jgi:hypothetical protein
VEHSALYGFFRSPSPPAAVVSFCAFQQHLWNSINIDALPPRFKSLLGALHSMLASTFLLFDWQAFLAAVVVVIAFLWIHFAFKS